MVGGVKITAEYLVKPVLTDRAVSLLSQEKCKVCGDKAMHSMIVKGEKVFHCPKKVCIDFLRRGEE